MELRFKSLLGLSCLAVNLSWAQTAATVIGTITDPSGAAVAGATVELTDASRHETRRQTANSAGEYSITGVLPGAYSVSAVSQGFKESIVSSLTVDVS
jgi:protocatechuate 3,4-dioxygenase beta subunit